MTPQRIAEFTMRLQQALQLAESGSALERDIIAQTLVSFMKEIQSEPQRSGGQE